MTIRENQSIVRQPGWPLWLGPVCALLVVLLIIMTAAGPLWLAVVEGATTDGATVLAYLLSAAGFGYWLMRAIAVPRMQSCLLLRAVTASAVGAGAMGLGFHLLGLAGWLSTVVVVATMFCGLAGLVGYLVTNPRGRFARARASWPVVALIAAAGVPLGLAVVAASLPPLFLWSPDPYPYDVLSYHLQVPREWFDAGRIIPLSHNVFSYFPMLMETHYLAAMHLRHGPWAGMYLCQFITLGHGVLAIIGVVGVARATGVSPAVAWVGGLLCATVPWVIMLSSVCYVEAGLILYTTLAVGWAMVWVNQSPIGRVRRGRLRQRNDPAGATLPSATTGEAPTTVTADTADTADCRRHWCRGYSLPILVGALIGLACGYKYTALVMLPFAIVVAMLATGRSGRGKATATLIVMIATSVVAGPWLVRNIIWTNNPLFPLATSVFGRGHFTEAQAERYTAAHQPPPREASPADRAFNSFRRTLLDPQFGYVLLPASLLAGGLLFRHRRGRFITIVAVGMVGIWIFATHDMPRFITPVVPLCALLVTFVLDRYWSRRQHRSTKPGRAFVFTAGLLVGLSVVVGCGWTLGALWPAVEKGRLGFFRLPDFREIEPTEVAAIREQNGKLALIGSGTPFLIDLPSDRLMYRTVFDVPVDDSTDYRQWLGENLAIDALRDQGYWVQIDGSEARRLSSQYRHMPTPDGAPTGTEWLKPD